MTNQTSTPTGATEPAAAAKILFIACKAPTGLLLELGNKGEKEYRKQLLKGMNQGVFRPSDGMFISTAVNGYGLTQVSAEFYGKWKRANKAFAEEYEAKRILVVCESKDEADAAMQDGGDVVTGFEPINPDKLPIKGLERVPPGAQVE